MTEIIAEAGRITGLGSEISSKIISGLQPAYAKKAGQPMKFVASAGQMADLSEDDLIIVRFSRSDHSTVVGPLLVASLPGRRAGKWTRQRPLRLPPFMAEVKALFVHPPPTIGGKRFRFFNCQSPLPELTIREGAFNANPSFLINGHS